MAATHCSHEYYGLNCFQYLLILICICIFLFFFCCCFFFHLFSFLSYFVVCPLFCTSGAPIALFSGNQLQSVFILYYQGFTSQSEAAPSKTLINIFVFSIDIIGWWRWLTSICCCCSAFPLLPSFRTLCGPTSQRLCRPLRSSAGSSTRRSSFSISCIITGESLQRAKR